MKIIFLLDILDSYFQKKRGYIVKMPEPGSSVVACLSGGQDSVANIGLLMIEYGTKRLPIFYQ